MTALDLRRPRYSVRWDCPHCGNSHNWWWEDEFEAHDDGECDMICDRCMEPSKCVGDGAGFYKAIAPDELKSGPGIERRVSDLESLEEDLHNYVRELEDKVNELYTAVNSLAKHVQRAEGKADEHRSELDNLGRRTTEAELAVWRLENDIKTPGAAKLGPQHVELAKEKERSFLDLITGEKPPFHARIREGCELDRASVPPDKLASILRFVAVEVQRMTERDMGGSFTISNLKVAERLRELADEAQVEDYNGKDEEKLIIPLVGDMRIDDADPMVMLVYDGENWVEMRRDND